MSKLYNYFSILVFILFSILLFQITVDDSYISWRYGKNLVEFGIWDFNLSFERVEAYTSFIYALLATVPVFLKINIAIFFKIFSLVLFSIKLFQYRSLIKSSHTIILFLLGCFTIFHPYFYVHLFSGLETPLFMFLLFDYFFILITNDNDRNFQRYLYFIFLLLPLVRPEGAFFSLIGVLYLISTQRAVRELPFLIIITLLGLIYFYWRYNYFGYLLPNTFYAKEYKYKSIYRIFNLFKDNNDWIYYSLILSLLTRNIKCIFFTLLTILCYGLAYGNSRLWMNFADRFLYQLFVPLYCCLIFNIKIQKKSYLYALTVLTFFCVYARVISNKDLFNLLTSWPRTIETYGCIAKAVDNNYSNRARILMGDVGYVPYITDADILDVIGLANTKVPRKLVTKEYIANFNPSVVYLYANTANPEDISYAVKNGDLDIYLQTIKSLGHRYAGTLVYNNDYLINIYLGVDIKEGSILELEIKNCINTSKKIVENINNLNHEYIKKYFSFAYL